MFETVEHSADLCVVGGGLAGVAAAVEAARSGLRVTLMQDRPVLGGNASSEIRMWVCGAHGKNNRETGLLEELMLENQYRNREKNYAVWDSVIYGLVRGEPNIELLLNCSCLHCGMDGSRIVSATGWQLTTQQVHRVTARLFADCSGDSALAVLAGADWRMGREARAEFGEDIEPEAADHKTMGMSCLLTAHEESAPCAFIPPAWAKTITAADLPHRMPHPERSTENFWYLELGGDGDAIRDTERVRDELVSLAYGLWDYVKNAPENREKYANWQLDWVGMLPGKRESRRCLGDLILTQGDVRSGGAFPDIVAYGGWTLDDHDPAGFYGTGAPNIHHPAPSPYGIPYRCLYSRNVDNLFFAGRNISVTHAALSSTRVMGTCALLGQAVGAAAALAVRKGLSPRGVGREAIGELQQLLMEDDCWLPGLVRALPALTREATLQPPEAEPLRSGVERPVGDVENRYDMDCGDAVSYLFDAPRQVESVRLVFDSDLNRETLPASEGERHLNMAACRSAAWEPSCVPRTLVRAFRLEGVTPEGKTVTLAHEANNYQRLRRLPVGQRLTAVRFIPESTWGAPRAGLFAFDVR